MSKISHLLVALGIVAGLGVTAIPLSTYATEGETTQPAQQLWGYGMFTVEVGGSISLYVSDTRGNATNNFYVGKLMNNGMNTDTVMVPVVTTNANTGYNLSMGFSHGGMTDDPEINQIIANDTNLRSSFNVSEWTDDNGIPMVGDDGKIQPGISAWGYKKVESRIELDENGKPTGVVSRKPLDSCDTYDCWKAIPAKSTVLIDSRSVGEERDYRIGINLGVSTNGTLAEGSYTGQIYFIATAQ